MPRIPISEDIINENSIYKYQQDMQMRMFKSDESLVTLQKNPLGQTTRVYKDDSLVKQKKYDEKERIFEEKIWKNDSQGFTLLSEKKHKYKSNERATPAPSSGSTLEMNLASILSLLFFLAHCSKAR